MSILVLIVIAITVPLQSAVAEDSLSSNQALSKEKRCEGFCMKDSADGKVEENYNDQEKKAIVCYFTNWSWYRDGKASFKPEDIDTSLCTHIIYSFAILDSSTLTIVPYDLKTDVALGYYKKVTDLKKKGSTVMISIGGWDDSKDEKWSRMLNSDEARRTFVSSIVEFLHKHNFDGLDLGYSYPGCPQGNMEVALPTTKTSFNKLLTELKTAFKGNYLLTVPTPAVKDYIDKCYDMAELCQIVDWVNLISYKYHSYEDRVTGAQSPMCGDDWTVTDTIKHYLETVKCPAEKLVLGFAFYTQTYTMFDPSPAQFGVPVSGPGAPGPLTKAKGFLAYYETCSMVRDGYNHGYNKINGGFAWHEKQFLSYEGVADIARKSCLINEFKLRGANLWSLDYDDFNEICGCGKYPLLKTLNQRLRGLTSEPITCY